MKERLIMCGIISIFFFVLITGFVAAAETDSGSLSTTNNLEGNSRDIIITENSGENLTNYQVPIFLNSSNFNFSQAKADGSDLRFSSRGKTLSYWIESWDPEAEEALIWVKIPSLPANKDTKLLMKYGDPEAEAVSNGDRTFEFFDDFEGDELKGSLWNSESAGGGHVDVKNDTCYVTAPAPHAYDSSLIYSKKTFGINSMFMVKRMKVTTGRDKRGPLLEQGFIDQITSKKNKIIHETELANESKVSWETAYRKERYNSFDKTDTGVSEGQWYTSGIAWYEENDTRHIAWFKNGIRDAKMDYSSNEYITNFPMHVYLYAESYSDASKNTGYMAVDYAFVRQFVESEPTVSFASDKIETEISADDNTSGTDNVSESETTPSESETTPSESETAPETETDLPEVSATEETPEDTVTVQESQSGNETQTQELFSLNTMLMFPESNFLPHTGSSFSVLFKDLKASRIDTIFLSLNGPDVWQYERFVKEAHDEGFSVYAVILEDFNCTSEMATSTSWSSLNAILDYNEKSLAPFDGINCLREKFSVSGNENSCMDYTPLFELASKRAGENVSISASLQPVMPHQRLKIFLLCRLLHCQGLWSRGYLNSTSNIVDTIAPEMGEIRGANSSGIIEISAEEGFEDKLSIQNLFASFEEYYNEDSAFTGVSIFNYDTYKDLLEMPVPKRRSSHCRFNVFSVLVAALGAFASLRVKKM
jgi:hypothetical protein